MKIKIPCLTEIAKNIMSKRNKPNQDFVSSDHYSLTPVVIPKKIVIKNEEVETTIDNPAYKPVLDVAGKLNEKEIKNIALSGPFGSGKSSILLTLKKDFPRHNYLNISLATLDCFNKKEAEEESQKQEKQTSKHDKQIEDKQVNVQIEDKQINVQVKDANQENEDTLNRKIEYSILQQLIYKEKIENIPQSRFKRIKHISKNKSLKIAAGALLFVISCCILFEPKYLRVESFYTFFVSSENWKIFWDIILAAYIIFFSVYVLQNLIIKTYNNRINKLNLKDGEIDIDDNPSIFNKHLDEIIYFFEVTEYDVVIIEDLDRFHTPDIFIKLRELNHLLNNSKAIIRKSGRIAFIYAIRDDIFKDTSRTKFFDYISTVIPVISTSNSRDILLKALREKGVESISEEVCMNLGVFIDDMRILKNIVNEFIQYNNSPQDILPEKMLGMILYKNYCPDDFAKLHNQKGIVYEIISNGVKYYNSSVREKDEKIKRLKEELQPITNYYSNEKAKELRAIYLMSYIQEDNRIGMFQEGNNQYSPSQLIEDPQLFQKLEDNALEVLYYSDRYNSFRTLQSNIIFQDIEKKVDPKYTYKQRLNLYPNRVDEINCEIEKLQQKKLELRYLPLQQILNNYSADDFFQDAKGNRLIAYLIRGGYIDENYYDYISYFYPGVMTPSDRKFIQDLKIGISNKYDYKIYKPKAVINDIHESLFSKPEILNIDILDFIVANKNEYSLQYIAIKKNIKKHCAFDFISEYYNNGRKEKHLFFIDIFFDWDDFFDKGILDTKSSQFEDINLELLLTYFTKSNFKKINSPKFKEYIAKRFDFIAKRMDIISFENAEFLIKTMELKFDTLFLEKQPSMNLISLIVEGNHYKLTNNNIISVLYFISSELVEIYKISSFTAIINIPTNLIFSKRNFVENILNSIEYCIDNIFPDTSIYEDEKTILEILNNEGISDEVKIKYLSKQSNKINLNDLAPNFWDVAIKSNVVKPTWENVEKYVPTEENDNINPVILVFISKNSIDLGQQKTKGSILDSNDSILFKKLIGSNILPLDDYKQIRKSFDRHFISYDLSEIGPSKMEVLINTNGLEFNIYYYDLVKEHFPNLTFSFILQNKSTFLSNIGSYTFDSNTAISLLNSNRFLLQEKLQIIQSLPLSLYNGNSTLSNSICAILNESKAIPMDNDFILNVLKNVTIQQQKLSLFVKKCNESTFNYSFIKSGLELLGGDYALIALQQGHRRRFIATKDNKELAIYLENNEFISSQKEKDGMIIMNARKV